MALRAELALVTTRRARVALYACTVLAYASSLHGPFHFDDFGVIVRYAPVHSLRAVWSVLDDSLRPLLKLTYAGSWALGLGPLGFHLENLALHLVNVELVLRLYSAASLREQRWPFSALDGGALCAGFLFALHPIQTEAVTYISGRSSSLSTCCALLAVLLYAAGARAGRAWPSLSLAALAYGGAVLSKETSATLPAALLLWELLIERGSARALLARQAGFWLLLLAALIAAVMHPGYYRLLYEMTGTRPLLASIAYQVDGVAYLLSRLVLVHRLSIDPGLGMAPPPFWPTALAGLALAGMAVLIWRQARVRPLLAFGLAWFLLHAFVPYVLIPRIDVLNERHMYPAGVGLFLAAGALWMELRPRLQPRRRLALALPAIVIALLIGFTTRRNLEYGSAIALWESTARVSSGNPRAHHNLAISYETSGRLEDARREYARAIALLPTYVAAHRGHARVLRRLGGGAAPTR